MTLDASRTTSIISRRTFLRTAAGATAGLAGILATKTPPLYAATRTVTMLQANHFVPASDENLKKWAKEFEKANKCRVKIDFIAHRDTYVKIAKEQETRQGHDIVFLFFSKPNLHNEDLEACMKFGNAVAALKCRLLGGRAALPTENDLRKFLTSDDQN